MANNSLIDKIFKCLQQKPGQKFTARQIANWIFETFPDDIREKQKRSTAKLKPLDNNATILQQIVAEIAAQRPHLEKKHQEIKTTEGRPRQYYFTQSTDTEEIDQAESRTVRSPSAINQLPIRDGEYALYPKLHEFLSSELRIYSKRIDEKKRSPKSRGEGGNKWLYPDLVGMEDLSEEWDREVKDCVQQYTDKKSKLWSFEVKILINRSNVREAFFQTVSNSSWANFAYLVASEIGGAGTLKELRMLSSLHGIGFIKLDVENPSDSQIMIPAKERIQIN